MNIHGIRIKERNIFKSAQYAQINNYHVHSL